MIIQLGCFIKLPFSNRENGKEREPGEDQKGGAEWMGDYTTIKSIHPIRYRDTMTFDRSEFKDEVMMFRSRLVFQNGSSLIVYGDPEQVMKSINEQIEKWSYIHV